MKRAKSLHDIGPGLLGLLWGIPAGHAVDDNENAVGFALTVAEQLHGRDSWQFACSLFHYALYSNHGKCRSFVNTCRRAVRIYRASGGTRVSNTGFNYCCYELATDLMERTPGKNRAEVRRLLEDCIEYEKQHGIEGVGDDARELLK